MDKREKIIFTLIGLYMLAVIFEFVVIPLSLKKYDIENIKRTVPPLLEVVIPKGIIKKYIDRPEVLVEKVIKEINYKNQEIDDKNKKITEFKKFIKSFVKENVWEKFDYANFYRTLKKDIKNEGLDIKLELPEKKKNITKYIMPEDKISGISKIKIEFAQVKYNFKNVDFVKFYDFLQFLSKNKKKYKTVIYKCNVKKSYVKDGNIDASLYLITAEKIVGISKKGKEVSLVK